jgi:hypothetical protein
MIVGGLNKCTTFLRANGAISLHTGAQIPAMRTCTILERYRLNDGKVVEVFEARLGNSPIFNNSTCNRFEVREVAA